MLGAGSTFTNKEAGRFGVNVASNVHAHLLTASFNESPTEYGSTGPTFAASGSLLSAELEGSTLFNVTDFSHEFGDALKGSAGAYGAIGELKPGLKLGPISATYTIGGSAGSAHIGSGFNLSFDPQSGILNLNTFEHFGLGVGAKIGIDISIDISPLLPSNDNE